MVGLWINIGIITFLKIKEYREFSGTLNRGVFIFSIILTGYFYSIWGDYTILFQTSLIGDSARIIGWHLIFGMPYILFGNILLFFSYKKYFYVYFGNKPLKARLFCTLTSFLFGFLTIFYLLVQGDAIEMEILSLSPQYDGFNLLLIFNMVYWFVLGIITIVSKRLSYSGLPIRRVENQISGIDRQISNVNNYTRNLEREEQNRRKNAENTRKKSQQQAKLREDRKRKEKEKKQRIERQRRQRELEARRKREKTQQNKQTSPTRSSSNRSSSRTSSHSSSRVSSKTSGSSKKQSTSKSKQTKFLMSMRPKSGTLTEDDFKCIFCFDLPHKKDKHRGVVVCPKCHYPAHYDEFKQWVRNSSLCSRCDGNIPLSFRKNPNVIPTEKYLKGYQFWKKRFKKSR